ncbi:neuroendocrine convertase 1-like [Cimex lectularius]|uniref:P/Homo B domain-containing protein n=1 Tax=Cimex lectularius TaxID=79782 RepID=A0A8I6RSZ4_CIMLE|nr:neuroendocrine convertase 1-like [Cimex lectularius]
MIFHLTAILVVVTGMASSKNQEDVWVATILGGRQEAQLLATRYGFHIVKQLDIGEDIYVLKKDDRIPLFKRSGSIHKSKKVPWIEKQVPMKREKRGIFSWLRSRYGREFNDDLWGKEWYIQDYRSLSSLPVLDLNVVPCYREGVTGKGVNVVVVDDGLEKDHVDLKPNYNPEISYDFNDDDPDPTPRYDEKGSNSHGTKCAGEIAMVANNKVCGVGIAYNASIGGLRVLDGLTTDMVEAMALSYRLDKVDIYSNSWGPSDDGITMAKPGKLLQLALEKGITKGRNGKGVIYIFASGNGKFKGDNCGADGYINSIYTVPIASASQKGRTVHYGERCAAIMATAYSSGGTRDEQVATTNLNNTCTLRHTGTSAAAPLAAGIAALVLEANSNLTWRDFLHLIAWTSEVAPLAENNAWVLNGFDFWVSVDFGFGLLNAHNLVRNAKNFVTVPSSRTCDVPLVLYGNRTIHKGSKNVEVVTDGCRGETMEINYLEHVQLLASISYPKRGSISVYLESPSGTPSILMEERPRDYATSGLKDWTMTSVHFWGESPAGIWTISIKINPEGVGNDFQKMAGSINSLRLMFHGTKEMPHHYRNRPRNYAPFMLYPKGPVFWSN